MKLRTIKLSIMRFGLLGGLAVAAVACAAGVAPREGALVANPQAEAWPTPSFYGKPFWPLFLKQNHKKSASGAAEQAQSARGCEDLPLAQEYASKLKTLFKSGVMRYSKGWTKDPETGKRIYITRVPEEKRLIGSYTLRQLFEPDYGDYLYSGDWKSRTLWNPREGSPFIIELCDTRPSFVIDPACRPDTADFEAWLKAHPNFLGFSAMGEIDSEVSNYIGVMKGRSKTYAPLPDDMRDDLLPRFPLPKDRYGYLDLYRRSYDLQKAFHFGKDLFWPLYCNNHTLAHINASMGAVGLQNEISSSQGAPWTWSGAYTRGASRQWGIPFAWYCATYSRSFRRNAGPKDKPVTGDNKWPRNGKFSKKRPAYMGASLSLTARQKYYGWLIGAAMIQDEPWAMLSSATTNGVPCPSSYAKVFNDVFVRSQKMDRGAPYTPVALLTPLAEAVSRGGYVNAEMDAEGWSRDDLNLPAYFFTLQPVHETSGKYPMLMDRRRQGDEGCLFNSKFGEIWDVLVADAKQPAGKFAAALRHYPAAFLLGTYRAGELNVDALKDYVTGGGTLFLSCDYVEEGLVPAALSGVSFAKGRTTSGASLLDEKGRAVGKLAGAYVLHAGKPSSGTRAFLKDEKGNAVAYVRQLGKGRVVTTACHRSMPEVFRTQKHRFNDETYQELRRSIIADEAELGLIRHLLDRVQSETIPVRVDGDIQWGVNLVVDGSCSCRKDESLHSTTATTTTTKKHTWFLWLINNKGIAKFAGEPEDVDPSKTAEVTVGLGALAGLTPHDADSGKKLPVADGAFKVKVGPGDVRFVTIK